jgi:hypothetical protein
LVECRCDDENARVGRRVEEEKGKIYKKEKSIISGPI